MRQFRGDAIWFKNTRSPLHTHDYCCFALCNLVLWILHLGWISIRLHWKWKKIYHDRLVERIPISTRHNRLFFYLDELLSIAQKSAYSLNDLLLVDYLKFSPVLNSKTPNYLDGFINKTNWNIQRKLWYCKLEKSSSQQILFFQCYTFLSSPDDLRNTQS